MKKLQPLLLTLLLAGSCSSSTTSLNVGVHYDATWPLDSIEVKIDNKSTRVIVRPTVRVLVPDTWAGQTFTLEVWGLQGATKYAYGRTQVTITAGHVVDADVTLAHTTCTDACTEGKTQCMGASIATCTDSDGDGCTDWGVTSACTMAPMSACSDASTLRIYDSPGMCALGVCAYTSHTIACDSCPNCDPCATVVCSTPPAASCTSSTTLRSYDASGTCSVGTCQYTPTDTTCPNGCTAGACKSAWTAQTSGTTFDLARVWGSSASDIYAVGGDSATASVILHSTGNGVWTPQSNPSTATVLLHAWGSGPSDVYVVGDGGSILHSTGNGTWTAQTSGVTTTLSSVWGSGPNDVYVVGDGGVILHSIGIGTWTAQTSGVTVTLAGLWGSGAGDVYTVGGDGAGTGTILHSTGAGTWAPQTTGTASFLVSIWGSGAGDVYAVGTSGKVLHSTGGGAWTAQTAVTADTLYDIWGSASNDIYAVGGDTTVSAGAAVHATGPGTWALQSLGTIGGLNGVWGTSSTNVYTVGVSGIILHHP